MNSTWNDFKENFRYSSKKDKQNREMSNKLNELFSPLRDLYDKLASEDPSLSQSNPFYPTNESEEESQGILVDSVALDFPINVEKDFEESEIQEQEQDV